MYKFLKGDQNGVVNVPRLILNNMRWVNYFVDPSNVANQLLETCQVMQPQVVLYFLTILCNHFYNLNELQVKIS